MSSEEAIQEVRRIFTNNSVDQARDYLSRITPGIQESDERLKQLVGQSYRGLVAACDQVVVVEQACRKLLRLQKQMQEEKKQQQLENQYSQSRLTMPQSPRGVSSPVLRTISPHGGKSPRAKNVGEGKTQTSRHMGHSSSASPPVSEVVRSPLPHEATATLKGVCEETPRGGREGADDRQRDVLIYTQQCAALEGLLGARKLYDAAALLLQIRRERKQPHEKLAVESYEHRLKRAVRGLLREDAEQAAQSALSVANANRNDSGGGDLSLTSSTNMFTSSGGVEFMGRATGWKSDLSRALAHMTEVHKALGVLSHATVNDALLLLIDTIHDMIKTDLDHVVAALKGTSFTQAAAVDTNTDDGRSLRPLRRMEWLRAALELPPYLRSEGTSAPRVPALAKDANSSTEARVNARLVVSEATVALHIVQRAQHLFSHLVLYVASVLYSPSGPAREGRGTNGSRGGEQPDEVSAGELDAYVDSQRRRYALQGLLALRSKLTSQESNTEGDNETSGTGRAKSVRMSGSLAREALSASQRGGSIASATDDSEKKDGDSKCGSLDASSSMVGLNQDGERRSRHRTLYLCEVMRQVCGMQILDPLPLQWGFSSFSSNEKIAKCSGVSGDETAVFSKVGHQLRAVQELALQLLLHVSGAGLLNDPRTISLQQHLARQQGKMLQDMLLSSAQEGSNLTVSGGAAVNLFDARKWGEAVRQATESALLKTVGAALKRADRVCGAILKHISEGKGYKSTVVASAEEQPPQQQKQEGPPSVTTFAQKVLQRSIFFSESTSFGLLHTDQMTCMVPCSSFGGGDENKRNVASAEKGENLNAALARGIMQCTAIKSKTTPKEGRLPANLSSKAGCRASGGNVNKDKGGWVMQTVETDAGSDDNLFSVDEGEEERTVAMEKASDKSEKGVTDAVDDDSSAALKFGSLYSMLQRIFEVERTWSDSHPTLSVLVGEWFTNILQQVRKLLKHHTGQLQKWEELNVEGNCFEAKVTVMAALNRISMLVEVLLQVLEVAAPRNVASTLPMELREAIVTCHTPWVKLLRSEWEDGVRHAYRRAFAPEHLFARSKTPLNSSATTLDPNKRTSCINGQQLMLEYATCWSCSTPDGVQCESQKVTKHPTHVTPHVNELIFQVQHMLFKNGVNKRLRATVLPMVINELLDGTSSALLNAVLPWIREIAAVNRSGNAGKSGDSAGDNDELLFQVYFDSLYISGLFSIDGNSRAPTPSITAVLRTIEGWVNPTSWLVISPLLLQASDRLLRVTALSFGSWNPKALEEVWTAKGTGDSRTSLKGERTVAGDISITKEKPRFPLLPLIFTPSKVLGSDIVDGGVTKTAVFAFNKSSSVAVGVRGDSGIIGGLSATSLQRGTGALVGSALGSPSKPTSSNRFDGKVKGWMGSLW
ncbi:hypothetical protein, conserved [Trypanosoma brucei brucei TREU927]|uniref:Conserved oligomeric Golgi complex subunit 1 n=1 Tax=Trypanosoma brucei brucei (strain 927/4 GUTat10.1) TaxID=185431 RepID=Q586L0_TRYB2|nr:hypothetical protein, conserved [Trypanosoma brucei brucei TREU927]AAQ15694.1 hypothetical protein, conserved [Trypanosoma brucei brucei TREU927]AAX79161.1 hypothetical protein, conserved [Trypanosoma brucei]